MSYQVYDEDGYKGDFATSKGGYDYLSYLRGLSIEEITHFLEEGYDTVPEAIYEAIRLVDPPDGLIKTTHENFLELLPKCNGIVIVSDGMNDDLEDIEE